MSPDQLRVVAKRIAADAADPGDQDGADFDRELACLFSLAADCMDGRPDSFDIGVQRRSLLTHTLSLAEATEALYEQGGAES